MFSGSTVIVSTIAVNTGMHWLSVSSASKTGSLSSCMSLLYASGRLFMTVRSPIRSP